MKKQLVKTTLFDSLNYYTNFPYDEYVDMCEECYWDCHEEDSEEYWRDIAILTEQDWDTFKDNMAYSRFKGQKCMITGSLGLWNGHPTIVPVLCNDIMEAIERCLDCNCQIEYEIILEDGHVEVQVHHHDGTNCFEIWLLSKKGLKEIERPKYECEDYNPNRTWFKNIYGWLY